MDKDLYAHWPEVDGDTLKAIGRFVVAWGVLETQIGETIADVYDLEPVFGLSITANLGTKAKLEMFMSGVALVEDWLPPGVDIRDANKMATDTADISNQYRNMVAHGQPIPIPIGEENENEMFPKVHWTWARISARKGGVKATMHHLSKHPFEKATSETVSLINRWTQFRLDTQSILRLAHSFQREQSDEPGP